MNMDKKDNLNVLMIGFSEEFTDLIESYIDNINIEVLPPDYSLIEQRGRDMEKEEFDIVFISNNPCIYIPEILKFYLSQSCNSIDNAGNPIFYDRNLIEVSQSESSEMSPDNIRWNDVQIFKITTGRWRSNLKVIGIPPCKYLDISADEQHEIVKKLKLYSQSPAKDNYAKEYYLYLNERQRQFLGDICFSHIYSVLSSFSSKNSPPCQPKDFSLNNFIGSIYREMSVDEFSMIQPGVNKFNFNSIKESSLLVQILDKDSDFGKNVLHFACNVNYTVHFRFKNNAEKQKNSSAERVIYLPSELMLLSFPKEEDEIIFTILTILMHLKAAKAANNKSTIYRELQNNNENLFKQPEKKNSPLLCGNSEIMKLLRKQLEDAAKDKTCHVLISGETGSGKEIATQFIIEEIKRTENIRKFKQKELNCATIEPNLAESHLFGHKKGAFTGAETEREGAISQANNGVLFLDEIHHMSNKCIAKLLRFMETGEYYPLGSDKKVKAKVKIIAALNSREFLRNKKLHEMGFFNRFSFHIHIPPLRYHPEDIEDLTKRFVMNILKENFKCRNPEAAYNVIFKKTDLRDKLKKWEKRHWKESNVRGLREKIRVYLNGILNADETLLHDILAFSSKRGRKESMTLEDFFNLMKSLLNDKLLDHDGIEHYMESTERVTELKKKLKDKYKDFEEWGRELQKCITSQYQQFHKKQAIRDFLSRRKKKFEKYEEFDNINLQKEASKMFNIFFSSYPS